MAAEKKFLKLYLDLEQYFTNEDMTFEDTGRLLCAAFDYMKSDEDPCATYFERGTQTRMAWRVIKSHLDACKAQAAINADNRRIDGAERNGTKQKETERTRTKENEIKGNGTKQKETERTRTKENERERNETEAIDPMYMQMPMQEQQQEQEQNQKQDHHQGQQQKQQEHLHAQEHTQEQEHGKGHDQDHGASVATGFRAAAAPLQPDTYSYTDTMTMIDSSRWADVYNNAIVTGITDGKEGKVAFYAECTGIAPSCTPDWVDAAIIQCQAQHRHTWAYFTSILRGYEQCGYIDTMTAGRPYSARAAPVDDLPL